MATVARESVGRWRAAISGVVAFVVFAVAIGAGTHNWPVGFLVGMLVGVAVFVSQWLVVSRRRR
jgi:hypothetical protein